MSFIQREIDRLNEALRHTPTEHDGYHPLHAAQQALSWALEPTGFSSPTATLHKYFGVGTEGTVGTGLKFEPLGQPKPQPSTN